MGKKESPVKKTTGAKRAPRRKVLTKPKVEAAAATPAPIPAPAVEEKGAFDPKKELDAVQKELRDKGIGGRRSKMSPYHDQIMKLDKVGAKPGEIKYWLKERCGVDVAQATVYQYVKKNKKK